MSLSIGTRIGPYEISGTLGAGGMGEVYRARDTRLDRDVAIKVLPESLAADPERIARFEREAKTLAALNHPNIAQIHGLEDADGAKALVMELVEGPTLADRIAQGPIPLDEAFPMAKQIAEALEAAHEQGIIHRDLKPANIKVRADGTVKVLDFGLAKAMAPVGSSPGVSQSPTITTPAMTQAGMILGTAAYMSPEQARGKTVDKRADIWAFACVLYEMLTGRRAFDGEDISEVLARVIEREPDMNALPAATPTPVRRLLRRAFTKDRRSRLADMTDARLEIEEARGKDEVPATAVASPSRRREYAWAAVALLFVVTTAGLAVRTVSQPPPDARAVVRFDVPPPAGVTNIGNVQLSPDGRSLAFLATSEGKRLVWVRPLDAAASQPILSTAGVDPDFFWSADSQSIGFSAEGRLKVVAAAGGPSRVLTNLPGGATSAGTWNADGVILLGATNLGAGGGLLRVSASGGQPVPASHPDGSLRERLHTFPHFLPDGRHFLYVARGTNLTDNAAYVGTLDSDERHRLPGIASDVRYSLSGHVVFLRDGALVAQPFDLDRLELSGDVFPVVDRLTIDGAVTGPFSVSGTDALAYTIGSVRQKSSLVWFDRGGRQLGLAAPAGVYVNPELSKDDRSVAWDEGSGRVGDTWVRDLERGLTSRLTSDPGNEGIPQWSPDGGSVALRSDRDGIGNLYQRRVGVVGQDTLLLKSDDGKSPMDWSLDGRYLAYTTGDDIWVLTLPDRTPLRITETPFSETNPRISPDGRWIAYQSNEAGAARLDEVYIRSFPEPGAKLQVSTMGGGVPRWRRDGKELFYLAPDRTLMAVPITGTDASPRIGVPVRLFQTQVLDRRGRARDYSVSSDGRFLMNTYADEQSVTSVTVVLNWVEELKRLVPTK